MKIHSIALVTAALALAGCSSSSFVPAISTRAVSGAVACGTIHSRPIDLARAFLPGFRTLRHASCSTCLATATGPRVCRERSTAFIPRRDACVDP